jgi:hypothetical protein
MACPWGGNGTVDDKFGGGEVRGVGADIVGVVNQVAADGEACAFDLP